MSYPKWVSRGYGLGEILCLSKEDEKAVLSPAADENDDAEGDDSGDTVESVRAKLDAAGIPYKKTLGLAKLKALLPQE